MQEAEGARGGGARVQCRYEKEAKMDTFRFMHRAFHVVFGLSLTVPKSKSSSLTPYRRSLMSLSHLLEEIFLNFVLGNRLSLEKTYASAVQA